MDESATESEELESNIEAKNEVWWVWVALGARTQPVVAMAVSDGDEFTAPCLWNTLPDEYRDRGNRHY